MSEWTALRAAVELVHMPSRARALRHDALPRGMYELLQVAADDIGVLGAASAALERPPALLRDAASFFIQQILLAPEADSYRVLAADAHAPSAELRRNMALLTRWLHPDIHDERDRSVFAARVTSAWEDLKTPDRRSAYDLKPRPAGLARGSAARPPGKDLHRSLRRSSGARSSLIMQTAVQSRSGSLLRRLLRSLHLLR